MDLLWRWIPALWNLLKGGRGEDRADFDAITREWRELAEGLRDELKEAKQEMRDVLATLSGIRQDLNECIEQRNQQQQEINALKKQRVSQQQEIRQIEERTTKLENP